MEDLHKMPLGVIFRAKWISHFAFSKTAGANVMFQGMLDPLLSCITYLKVLSFMKIVRSQRFVIYFTARGY